MQVSDGSNELLAIPLWINGHAFLTLAPTFCTVKNPRTGEAIRQTPLCGPETVAMAVEAALTGLDAWKNASAAFRGEQLQALADALDGYTEHFAKLIVEEAGKDLADASLEVAQCVAALKNTTAEAPPAGLTAIIGNSSEPLLGAILLATPALRAGSTVIFMPQPKAPSAIYALAELSGRCAFPGGVFSVVYGETPALDALQLAVGDALLFA